MHSAIEQTAPRAKVTATNAAGPPPVPAPSVRTAAPRSAFHRYHIDTADAPDIEPHPTKFRVKTNRPRLLGLLLRELIHYRGKLPVVLARPCVYGVFGRPVGGMAPIHAKCVGCLRCSTQYPDVVQIHPNPARRALGDSFLTPDHVDTILYEARGGRVPVRGAGYRGGFGGAGWDGMWTDMSEIVRPTRDGIHGREYISTVVDIGEKPAFIARDAAGRLIGAVPRTVTIQLPMLLDLPPVAATDGAVARTWSETARRLETLAVLPLEVIAEHRLAGAHLAPLVTATEIDGVHRLPSLPAVVFLDGWDKAAFAALRERLKDAIVGVRVAADTDVAALARAGVRVFHLVADYHGRRGGDFAIELIQRAHQALVEAGMREEATLVGSGGIVLAEHVAKAIICGLDAVGIDTALAVAIQGRFAGECTERGGGITLPRFDERWAVTRLANLAAAWRDQLLELMGAMGLREVRRMRGEVGRCMFQDDLEREAFGGIEGYER
jgi:hypothetical protein